MHRMNFLHSIRWRLQLWHGLLLAFVLAGFGVTAARLHRADQWARIDRSLEERLAMLPGAMRRDGGFPGKRPFMDRGPLEHGPMERGPGDRGPGGDRGPMERGMFEHGPFGNRGGLPPPEPRFSERDISAFESLPEDGSYCVAWFSNGRTMGRSKGAPEEVPLPERAAGLRQVRLRGTWREFCFFTPPGDCVLVGRDVREDLATMRRFAWLLAGVGAGVLALGLAGGWWVSTRALQPISAISATASRIAAGDLSQRIPSSGTENELGELARVLNDTFARLQAAFGRQAQFTADASHELRTPLTVVLMQTQTALARERTAAEYQSTLEACQRAGQRMRRLIESLLTLARLDAGEPVAPVGECPLDRVAAETVELLWPLAGTQRLTLALQLEPVRCPGEVEQVGLVVSNLVSNAIHYNRPDGTVTVKTGVEGDWVVLQVRDTGLGIGPEDLPRVFDRFYRVDKARSTAAGRTGLGLAITKAIVELQRGTIEVTSTPGEGSVFTVRWPRPAEAAKGD